MMNYSCYRTAIYGAGAMGTVLGALLSEAGKTSVDLISRNREHIRAMKERGAHIVCVADGTEFTVKVNALLPEEMTGKYDVIFLMTKQRENAEIVRFLKNHLSENGVICTTQNGFPESSVAEIIGEEKTYGAVCAWGATFVGSGETELTSARNGMSMEIGGLAEKPEKLSALCEILRSSGISVSVSENFLGARWSKLSINAAFSGLSVVTGLTFGQIAKKRKTRKLALGILREGFAVAEASGVVLAPMQGHDMVGLLGKKGFFGTRKALFVLPIAMRKHKRLVSGMLKDVQKGRKCEIDYIDGVIVRYGDRCGIDTPLCDKTVELVHGIENGLYEISYKNVDFFF